MDFCVVCMNEFEDYELDGNEVCEPCNKAEDERLISCNQSLINPEGGRLSDLK